MVNTSQLISLQSAGERKSLHPITIRRAVTSGELPGYKIGRSVRVDVDDLEKWIESKRITSARIGPGRPRANGSRQRLETSEQNEVAL